jgi:dolichol-phosphate mannosyltransferase
LSAASVPSVGIVIPVYHEEEIIEKFHARLRAAVDRLPFAFTVTYVNDGSRDGTGAALERIRSSDSRVGVVELSRNFGHQAALTAGLDRARGDYVISMDGDGQHPPEMIAEMLKMAQAGCDLVLTQRLEDERSGGFKRLSAQIFYELINRLGETRVLPGGADFRLMSRTAADGLRGMREYHRFLRGMVAWMGYRTAVLPYPPAERLGGKTKYTLRKMLRLARDAIFSFSLVPLYLGLSLGALFLVLSLVEVVYVLSFWASGRQASLEPGWSSLMFVLLVVGGILMILLGFIGVYTGFIFQEVKGRPVYLVRQEQAPARKVHSQPAEEEEFEAGRE